MPDLEEVPDLRRPPDGEPVSASGFVKPAPPALEGRYVRLARIDAEADLPDLFACGHTGDAQVLWRFMPYVRVARADGGVAGELRGVSGSLVARCPKQDR